MKFRTLLMVLFTFVASSLFGQDSRSDQIEQEKAQKAKELKHYVVNKVEKFVSRLDKPRNGLFPVVGSAYGGGGFALGAGYQKLIGDRDFAEIHGLYSIENYRQLTATGTFLQSPFGLYGTDFYARYVDAGHVSYYGIGNDSRNEDRTTYGYSPIEFKITERIHPLPYIFGGGSFGYLKINTGPTDADHPPPIETIFTPQTAPGIGTDPEYTVGNVFAAFDWRETPGYTRSGGYYRLDFYNYNGLNQDASTDFQRYDFTVAQYIPVLRGNQVIALRALASITDVNGNEEIPFFLLPRLGGGEELRGFRTQRFRDRDRLLMTAEYRWAPSKFMDMAIFYEAGKVASRTPDLDFNDLHTCWGFGARFHAPAATILRIEFAHSNETDRIIFGTGLNF
jgi:outer membrane protein assembly factor BamA